MNLQEIGNIRTKGGIMSKEQRTEKKPIYEYTGESQLENTTTTNRQDCHLTDSEGRVYYPYIPSDDLKEAVNLAIALKRPLLLEGEPGCGKTGLAEAVVREFTHEYLRNEKDEDGKQKSWPYYIWDIKSTTRARDGLYRFDTVARLRDAQLMGTNPQQIEEFLGKGETDELRIRLKDKTKYLELGPLGEALKASKGQNYPPILLIDEIDKADSDFANDLLFELEKFSFKIPETKEEFSAPANNKPIIFITSNREKPLPEPFLRRCIYFYVEFPQEKILKKIINKRFSKLEEEQEALVQEAIKFFYEIRKQLKNNPGSRPPGTSELIDFIDAIKDKRASDSANLFKRLPLLGILVKTKQEQDFILHSLNKTEKE
ncbi:hypothetical protein RIVM261_073240 [Rivularia sp. IAM M-261]|nr:hypothetical protein RIVM261_073240 [Rivularia sp. IAM M-261]